MKGYELKGQQNLFLLLFLLFVILDRDLAPVDSPYRHMILSQQQHISNYYR